MKKPLVFSSYDIRDYKLAVTKEVKLPDSFELQTVRVKNQEDVGSCVAFTLSEVVEYFNLIQEHKYVTMSTGYLYGNREALEEKPGYSVRVGLKMVQKYGLPPYKMFPYNEEIPKAVELYNNRDKSIDTIAYSNRISTYFRIYDEKEIKYSLYTNGPVACALYWPDGVTVNTDGILNFPEEKTKDGHCILIYGWNDKGWLIQNSWGNSWGNKGRAILPYNIPVREFWGITDTIVNTTKKKKINNTFAKIFNFIVNFLLRYVKKENI